MLTLGHLVSAKFEYVIRLANFLKIPTEGKDQYNLSLDIVCKIACDRIDDRHRKNAEIAKQFEENKNVYEDSI